MSSNPAPPGALASPGDSTCTNRKIAPTRISPEPTRPLPDAIGRYRVVRLLGEGGMGTVYEAEQDQPRRMVAIKVLKSGLLSPDLRWRFEHETQALGRLRHAGIAQIYEAGTADSGSGPQPYFAMELVRGEPLLQYAEGHRLNTRQRLEVMVRICNAVQHAHQSGIIHRDLKPSNILIEESGQPKILDLGVARITDSDTQATQQTDLGQLVGTLAYMSPEQVLADPLALDTRSDVYALGVILFELLAGRLPYKISGQLLEAVQTIREEDPTRLSAVSHTYRGDIETIVGKALEKDKTRRYASAADLAADIQRYLHDEPITARPPSATYQLKKFARRNKALVAGIVAVFVVLIAGIIVSTWEAAKARRAEASARQAEATANAVNDFLQKDLLAQASPQEQGRPDMKPDPDLKVRTALDRAAARVSGKFGTQPLVEASVRQTIGNTYKDLGLYPEAQRQLERAMQLRRRVLGEKNSATLSCMNDLGQVYMYEGRGADAETLFKRVLEARRRLLGEQHPDTLKTTDNLGDLYFGRGRYADAEHLISKGLDLRRRVLGETRLETIDSIGNLAAVYTMQAKYPAAEQLALREVELRNRVQGAEHPTTLLATNNLAFLYLFEANYASAEPLFVKVLASRLRVLGPEHPDTIVSMTSLADLYIDEGKYVEAEPLYTRALEIERTRLGEEHQRTLFTMGNLAHLYACLGMYARAQSLYTRVREMQQRILGQDNPDTLVNERHLAELYRDEGRYAEAERLLAKVLEAQRRVWGIGHPGVANTINATAMLYVKLGRYAEAEPLFKNALDIRRGVLGPEHPDTLDNLTSLGELYVREQRHRDGELLLRPAVASFAKSAVADSWRRYDTASLLGASLAGQKKFAEAESLLISGYEGMLQRQSTIPAFDQKELKQAGQRIVQLYQTWGKPNKAAEWRAKLAMSSPAAHSQP